MRRWCLLLVVAVGCCCPLAAQFIGYTLPQTTQQTLLTGAGIGVSANVRNIGQSVHLLVFTVAGAPTELDLRLEASYDGSTYFNISEEGTLGVAASGGLSAFGYFPFVRCNVVNIVGGTVTVYYTGTVTAFAPAGSFQNTLTMKSVASTQTANAGHSYSIQASGILGGMVFFRFSDGACAGSTLTVQTGTPIAGAYTPLAATVLTASATPQVLYVPSFPGISLNFIYATGCGAATTFDLNYGLSNAVQLIGTLNASNIPVPAGSGASSLQVQGTAANGTPSAGNPVYVVTRNQANLTHLGIPVLYNPGDANANSAVAWGVDASSAPGTVFPFTFNGATWDRKRSTSLTNFPASTTLVARNSIGAGIAEKGSRWSVFSNPVAGTIASASIAAEASVRHVADCVSFSAAATVAPAATALTINLRDGATGAGTIIWTWQVVVTAATGTLVVPHSVCGLMLAGTNNTAMTLEFSAGLANLIESVSISGINVN